jgi:hypothetical protein
MRATACELPALPDLGGATAAIRAACPAQRRCRPRVRARGACRPIRTCRQTVPGPGAGSEAGRKRGRALPPKRRDESTTTRPLPAAFAVVPVPRKPWHCSTKASWSCRPPSLTKTSSTEAAFAVIQLVAAGSKIFTGVAKPFSITSPASRTGIVAPAFRAACCASNICPPRASLHRRAARLVTLPMAP